MTLTHLRRYRLVAWLALLAMLGTALPTAAVARAIGVGGGRSIELALCSAAGTTKLSIPLHGMQEGAHSPLDQHCPLCLSAAGAPPLALPAVAAPAAADAPPIAAPAARDFTGERPLDLRPPSRAPPAPSFQA